MTLLEAIWNSDEESVRGALLDGSLELTGNFKGQEVEVASEEGAA